MEVWEQSWAPHCWGEAGGQRREPEEGGQVEEEVGEVVADHRLQASAEAEEDKHPTSRGETEEQVGRGRRRQG